MAISEKPWSDFHETDYSADQWCHAALIDENPTGEPKKKNLCKLPVNEPNGDLNRNGVHAAAAALAGARGGVQASPALKKAAARKLVAIYRSLHEPPPDSITRLAG
jgi:hypothetical protein